MKLILSDRSLAVESMLKADDRYVNVSDQQIHFCVGCFGCWVKTPGKCVIRDDAVQIYPLIAKSEKIMYVSQLFYGSYDTAMKKMLERSLPIQQAFLRLYHGETHHIQRAVVEKEAVIIAYAPDVITDEEQTVFRHLVERNALNMMLKRWTIHFVRTCELEETVQKEVAAWGNS